MNTLTQKQLDFWVSTYKKLRKHEKVATRSTFINQIKKLGGNVEERKHSFYIEKKTKGNKYVDNRHSVESVKMSIKLSLDFDVSGFSVSFDKDTKEHGFKDTFENMIRKIAKYISIWEETIEIIK